MSEEPDDFLFKKEHWPEPVEPLPTHPDFPALVLPEGATFKPNPFCSKCLHHGKDKHKSYGCGRLNKPIESKYRMSLSVLRFLQYVVHLLNSNLTDITAPNPYTGSKSLNFYDRQVWEVESVEKAEGGGCVIVARFPDNSDPGKGHLYYELRSRMPFGQGRKLLQYLGPVQPNDIVVAGEDSVLYGKLRGRVRSVVFNRTNMLVTMRVDKDFSNLKNDRRIDQTNPPSYTISTFRAAGDMEKFLPVNDLVPMVSSPTKKEFLIKNEDMLSNNWVHILPGHDNKTGLIAYAEAGDGEGNGRPRTLWVYLVHRNTGVEEDITNQILGDGRIRCSPDEGVLADKDGKYTTRICLGTVNEKLEQTWDSGIATNVGPDDLRDVKVIYYPEATDAEKEKGQGMVLNCRNCQHAVLNPPNGLSFYDMDDGEAEDSQGRNWHCKKRVVMTPVQDEMTGEWDFEVERPSGISMFRPHCSLWGVCDMYKPADRGAKEDQPFSYTTHFSQFFQDLIYSQPIRLQQLMPGYGGSWNYQLHRVGAPSILSLAGSLPMNPDTMRNEPNVSYPENHFSFVSHDQVITTDPVEGSYLDSKLGLIYNVREALHEMSFPDMPEQGWILDLLESWGEGLDPLLRPLSDGDAYNDIEKWFDETNPSLLLQTGETNSTSIPYSDYSVQVSGDEEILIPAVGLDVAMADVEQDRGDAVFTLHEFDKPIGSEGSPIAYRSFIQVKPLINDNKEPSSVVSGVIHSVNNIYSINGTPVYRVHIENIQQRWSRIQVDAPGDSRDVMYYFNAGGGFVLPPWPYRSRNKNNLNAVQGGSFGRARIGDSVEIAVTNEGVDKNLFTIVRARAFDPNSAAPDFGTVQTVVYGDIEGGYYQCYPGVEEPKALPDTGRVDISEVAYIDEYWVSLRVKQPVGYKPGAIAKLGKDGFGMEIFSVMSVSGPSVVNGEEVWSLDLSRNMGSWAMAWDTVTDFYAELVLVWESSPTPRVLTPLESEELPEISDGEFWIDQRTNRIYVSEDTTRTYVFSYMEAGKPNLSDNNYVHDYGTPVNVWKKNINGVEVTGAHWNSKNSSAFWALRGRDVYVDGEQVPDDGTVFTEVITGFPPDEQVVFVFLPEYRGKTVSVRYTDGDDQDFEYEITSVPGFPTYGKYRDYIDIADDNDRIEDFKHLMPGKNITVWRQKQVFSPTSDIDIYWSYFGDEEMTKIDSSQYAFCKGTGRIFFAPSLTGTLIAQATALNKPLNFCFNLKGKES